MSVINSFFQSPKHLLNICEKLEKKIVLRSLYVTKIGKENYF